MILTEKNGQLFAVDRAGNFVGKVVNDLDGSCRENPAEVEAGMFSNIFGGHGHVYHQDDNPPNPFFVRSWDKVFANPELLPPGTKNVFVDQGQHAKDDWGE